MARIDAPPRRFHLFRRADPTGVSGTGIVAEGAVWSSGAVALHWPGYPRSTSIWTGLDELIAAHGHDGLTEVRWIDGGERPTVIELPDQPLPDQPFRDGRGWPLPNPYDSGA